MSESVKEKKSSKTVVILLIVLVILVIGGIIAGVLLLQNRKIDEVSGEAEAEETKITIGYEGNGVVAMDADEFQRLMEEMQREAEEGMIDITFQNTTESKDGVNFTCQLGNPISNRYDEYFQILLDGDVNQQVLLTGLIPPGQELSSFESEIPLEPGEYRSVLVITQIEDDHATIHAQTMLTLTLAVLGDAVNEDVIFN